MTEGLPTEALEHLRKIATPAHMAQYVTKDLPEDSEAKWLPFRHHLYMNHLLVEACTAEARSFINMSVSVRMGKSEIISRYLPVWYLGMYPDRDVVIVSNSSANAEKWGLATRNLMQQFGPELFGLHVDPSSASKTEWGIKGRKGTLRAVGIGTQIEGRGIHLGVLDDVIGQEQAMSPTERRKTWDWYTGAYRTRLMPGATTLLVMSRWHCLLPGSEIEVADGRLVPVEAIEGESVATSGGWDTPSAFVKRDADEEAVSVRFYGLDRPLRVTADHRILTVDGWRQAGDLKAGDRIVSKPTPSDPWTPPPAPAVLAQGTSTTAGAVLPPGVPAWHISVLHGAGYDDRMLGERYGKSRQWARQLRIQINGWKPARSLDPAAFDDPEVWWAIGLWAAEGSFTSGRKGSPNVAVWTLGWHERTMADRIRRTFEKHGLTASIRAVRNTRHEGSFPSERGCSTWTVRVSSKWLTDVLRQFGSGAHHKRIPSGVEALDRALVRAFVDGAYAGDGTWQGEWLRYATVSRDLAFGLRRCLVALGASPTVMKSDRVVEVRVKASDLDGGGVGRSMTRNESGDLIHRVKSVERFHYTGPVYDITTASHDFRAEGVTIHNCEDLAGMIEEHYRTHPEGDPWVTVKLPAIAEAPKGAGQEWRNVLGQADGEALWPERWPLADLHQLRESMQPATWESRYQQNPTLAEGGMFKVGNWQRRPSIDRARLRMVRCWDLAATEDGGDWTVGVLMGMDPENHVYILDVQRFRKASAGVKAHVKATADQDGRFVPIRIEQERAGAGKAQIADYKRLLVGFVVNGAKPEGTKVQRAGPFASQQQDSNVWLVGLDPDLDRVLVEEHRVFDRGRHDDIVDSCSGAFDELARVSAVTITTAEDVGVMDFGKLADLGFGATRNWSIPVG